MLNDLFCQRAIDTGHLYELLNIRTFYPLSATKVA